MSQAALRSERTALQRVRDALVVACALALAAVTLSFPFGRDQGLFQYVGREWFLRGRMPYRDVFEQKTPLIYFVHGLLALAFGSRMWPIRLVEIGVVVLTAKCATLAAVRAGQRPAPGAFAATLFLTVTFYFGWFTFWDTGNCEIWVALFVVAALAALRSIEGDARAAYACGVAMGLAVVAKLPAVWFVPPVLLVACVRYAGARARLGALVRFGAGAAIFPVLVCVYFAAKGDLWDLWDVVVRANSHMVARERTVESLGDVLRSNGRTIDWFAPYSYVAGLVAIATAWAWRKQHRAWALRYGVVLLLIVAAYASVAMQLRFFVYHYGMLVVPAAIGFALASEDLASSGPARLRAYASTVVAGLALALFSIGGAGPRIFRARAGTALAYVRGGISSSALDTSFDMPGYFANTESHQVADWLRARSTAPDNIVVRGYEPQIYALSDRFFDGRFFWTTFLTHPARDYRREAWLEQDRRDIVDHPPRYAVTFGNGPGEVDNASWFEDRGFVLQRAFGPFVVLSYSGRTSRAVRHCATALGDETVTLRDGFTEVEYEGTPTPLRWSGERGTIVLRSDGARPTWLRLEGRTAWAPEQPGQVDVVIDGVVRETRDTGAGQISIQLPIAPRDSAEVVIDLVARPALVMRGLPRGFVVSRVCWD